MAAAAEDKNGDVNIRLSREEVEIVLSWIRREEQRRRSMRSSASAEDIYCSLKSKLTGDLGRASVETMMSAYSATPANVSLVARQSSRLAQPRFACRSENVDEWDFDLWTLVDAFGGDRIRASLCLVEQIFRCFSSSSPGEHGLCRPENVVAFAEAIVERYEDVPYHNCLHGADVMQAMHSALKRCCPSVDAAPEIRLVALVSALAHDVGHPGLTNSHLVETRHELALRYNDQSPLENFHVAVGLEVAKKTGFWDAAFPTPDLQRSARFAWIQLTLATDMSHHVDMISNLRARKDDAEVYDAADSKNCVPVLGVLMHCCDLSNPTRPWNTYEKWTNLIMEEFYAQADLEIHLLGKNSRHRPPSLPTRDTCRLDQFQLAFLGFIRPLFVAANDVQNLDLSLQLANLDRTMSVWEERSAAAPNDHTSSSRREQDDDHEKTP